MSFHPLFAEPIQMGQTLLAMGVKSATFVDECNDDIYIYHSISEHEFQFGRQGDIMTNYDLEADEQEPYVYQVLILTDPPTLDETMIHGMEQAYKSAVVTRAATGHNTVVIEAGSHVPDGCPFCSKTYEYCVCDEYYKDGIHTIEVTHSRVNEGAKVTFHRGWGTTTRTIKSIASANRLRHAIDEYMQYKCVGFAKHFARVTFERGVSDVGKPYA